MQSKSDAYAPKSLIHRILLEKRCFCYEDSCRCFWLLVWYRFFCYRDKKRQRYFQFSRVEIRCFCQRDNVKCFCWTDWKKYLEDANKCFFGCGCLCAEKEDRCSFSCARSYRNGCFNADASNNFMKNASGAIEAKTQLFVEKANFQSNLAMLLNQMYSTTRPRWNFKIILLRKKVDH